MFQPTQFPSAPRSSLIGSITTSLTTRVSELNGEMPVSYYLSTDLSGLTAGLVQRTNGVCDGWPSNDVPLMVMYSTNMDSLTQMRRLVQASGVRFLGYDRTSTLMDALAVLNPVAVLIDEADSAAAHRIGRQILAYDFTYTLVRMTNGAAVAPVKARRKAVGSAIGLNEGVDGPFSACLPVDLTSERLIAALGRLGVLPRRLLAVR
jgi:hypothetical protein